MIYMDNAATTKPNRVAVEKAQKYLLTDYYNPSALYKEGFSVQTELKEAHERVVSAVADKNAYSVAFTSCGTEADNTAVLSYCKRGNAVTTKAEHSAMIQSFKELNKRGVETRFASINRDGSVNIDDLLSKIDEKTTFVSVMHVNNEFGAINDIDTIARLVKEKNPKVIFHSDGVQAFGKLPYKLSKYIDLYSISAHKIGGLKGTGGLIRKKTLPMSPYIFGGGQENGERSGTENVFGIKAFQYAVEEKMKTLREDYECLQTLKKTMVDGLDKNVYTVLSGENSTPYILLLSAKGLRGEILMHLLNDHCLIVGTGSACSSNAKTRYSQTVLVAGYDEETADGIIRISFSNETTFDEAVDSVRILNETGKELFDRMK